MIGNNCAEEWSIFLLAFHVTVMFVRVWILEELEHAVRQCIHASGSFSYAVTLHKASMTDQGNKNKTGRAAGELMQIVLAGITFQHAFNKHSVHPGAW